MHCMHQGELSRLWRGYPHPMPDKRACRSSGGYAKWIRRTKFAEPHLIKLHKYDATACILFMERYRSGHNGADSKSVCAKAHEGSNPSLSANAKDANGVLFALAEREGERTRSHKIAVRFYVKVRIPSLLPYHIHRQRRPFCIGGERVRELDHIKSLCDFM